MEPLRAGDPAMIGGFRLRGRLGSGGMGRVYLGMAPSGRLVAVKVVRSELARDNEFLRRFRGEVAAAQAVSGLYTAPVVATGLDSDPPWLATTFIAAPTLQQAVDENGPLPEAAVWRLGAGLAEALAAVHACGLVHRDLKPNNVLLAEDGPRVIDFGVSRALDGTVMTRPGMTIGTPPFMSPEQAEGTPLGMGSDVFSFGSVLCFAACGSPPFGDGSVPTVLYRVVNEPPALDRVPAGLRATVARCLVKDPARRPSVAELAGWLATGSAASLGDEEWTVAFWPIEVELRIRAFRASLAELPMPPRPAGADEPRTVTRERAVVPPARSVAAEQPAVPGQPAAAVSAPVAAAAALASAPRRPRLAKPVQGAAGTVLWRAKSEPVQAMAVAAGVCCTATQTGKISTLNATSGKRIWRRPLPVNLTGLVADDKNVYVLGDTGTYALNGAIGQTVWQREACDGPLSVGDGVVYLGEKGHAVALTAELGRTIWRTPLAAGVAALAVGEDTVYATVTTPGSALVSINAATGDVRWRQMLAYQNPWRLVTAGGVVYVTGWSPDGWVLAIDARTGRQLWEFLSAAAPVVAAAEGLAYICGTSAEVRTCDVRSGLPGWTREFASAVTAGPAVSSGLAYIGLETGEVHALDMASGDELWSYPLGAQVTSLTAAGGIAYAIADSGIYAFPATP